MSAPQKVLTPNTPRLNSAAEGAVAEWGMLNEPRLHRRKPSASYGIALPWDDFATAWSSAEEQLARLEQQLSSSDLRHCWICRADFQEAAALAALQGDPVAMDELVMVDAGAVPARPTPAWSLARALLAVRRHISRAGPAKVLSPEGILELESRLAEFLGEFVPDSGLPAARSDRQAIQRWLTGVEKLGDMPALPAAAIALRNWRRAAPLTRCNDEIGLILAAALLWRWDKTKGLTACLAGGGFVFDDRAPLGPWIERFCAAVAGAAREGQDSLQTMTRGRARITKLLMRHRAHSRLPRLAWLLLTYPVMPPRFIQRRLGITPQGTDWLLKQLINNKIVSITTKLDKKRTYKLSP